MFLVFREFLEEDYSVNVIDIKNTISLHLIYLTIIILFPKRYS